MNKEGNVQLYLKACTYCRIINVINLFIINYHFVIIHKNAFVINNLVFTKLNPNCVHKCFNTFNTPRSINFNAQHQ